MRAKVYHPTCEEYTSCLQRGGLPVYSGTVMQRGYGIGGIFKGLASFLIPLLPGLGKAVVKTAIRVVNDKMPGVPLSQSIKRRSMATGKSMILNAISNRKPSAQRRRNKRPSSRRNSGIRSTDAFGAI